MEVWVTQQWILLSLSDPSIHVPRHLLDQIYRDIHISQKPQSATQCVLSFSITAPEGISPDLPQRFAF
jgi:hypothetical protein